MKRIFLTGASSGIGRAIAEELSAAGHRIWGTARQADRVPALAGVRPLALDLARPESLGGIFQSASAEAGGFDVVINNAGSGYFGPAAELQGEELARHFQVLVFGQITLLHLAIEAMRSGSGGRIINVTSLASRLPVPYMAAYNAAKAALASYVMSLQLELADDKVKIIDLQPADIRTNFNDVVQKSGSDDPRVTKTWQAVDRNMKEAPSPQLVAKQVVRLIEDPSPPPRITVGGFFQAEVAPLILRLLPQRVRIWGLRRYYGI
jgi:short-subunit dehydrogenase